MRIKSITAASLVAALAVAGAAFAEPARKLAIGPGAQTLTWEGTGSGVLATQDAMDSAGCQPLIHECDDTLIEVKGTGKLTIETSSTDPKANDTDLQLFSADEQGNVKTELKESAAATPTPAEKVSAEVEPGFYIARIDYAIAVQGVVKGEAKFEPLASPVEASAKKPGSKNVKSFSGTAKAEEGAKVKLVEIGLIQKGKSDDSCKELNKKGKFENSTGKCSEPANFIKAKGTTKWSYKLKKKLPKGSYVLFARASDDAGNQQAGFGDSNKIEFTVR